MSGIGTVAVLVFSFFLGLVPGRALGQAASNSASPSREPLSQWSRQWLDEVVPYIITGAEKDVFISLPTEEERGRFIAAFWKKRDPDPRTAANEFKLEHYRRIALANTYLGTAGIAGWRTDRGKICILLGPPDEMQKDMSPADPSSSIFRGPKETWSYWGLSDPGLPYNLELTFVDRTGTGHYVLDRGLDMTRSDGSALDLDSLHQYFNYQEYLARATRNPFENMHEPRGTVTTEVHFERPALEAERTAPKGEEGLSRATPAGGGELELSEIILKTGAGGDPASGTGRAVGDAGQKPGFSAGMPMPVMERVFRVGDELEAAFEIHNMSRDPQTGRNAFQVEYSFFQDDVLVTTVPASGTEATADRDCRVRTSLRLKNFKPGRYRLRATVRDLISGKSAFRDAAFSIVP